MKREARNISKEAFRSQASESFQRIESESDTNTKSGRSAGKAAKKAAHSKPKKSLKSRFGKLLSSDPDSSDHKSVHKDSFVPETDDYSPDIIDNDPVPEDIYPEDEESRLIRSISDHESGDAQLVRNIAADEADNSQPVKGPSHRRAESSERPESKIETIIPEQKTQPAQRPLSARELILAAVRESENNSSDITSQKTEAPSHTDTVPDNIQADDILNEIIVNTPVPISAERPSLSMAVSQSSAAPDPENTGNSKYAAAKTSGSRNIQPVRRSSEAAAGKSAAHPARRSKMTPEKRRKRADMQASSKAVLMFCAFMLIMAIILLVVPRSTSSEIERRTLSTMPEFSLSNYFNGTFTSGITQYYDDTVPARDTITNASNTIKSLFGFTTSGTAEIIGNVAKVNTEQETTQAESETAAEAAAEQETETETETEEETNSKDYKNENADATMEDGILVVYQDNHYRALALFGGLYEYRYADVANYIHGMLGDSVSMYFMPLPLASQFYLPANYSDYSADQEDAFKELYSQMNSDIKFVEVCDTLEAHNAEDIYMRTDHHWQPLGAYYAAQEFAKAADVPFTDISEYTKHEVPGYVGTMYAYTSSANILYDPDTFVWYSAPNHYSVDYYDSSFNYLYNYSLFFDMPLSNIYCTFLGSDDEIAKITTDCKNGRTLLMVKDSYGNAMVPFLTGSFEYIYVVDQRYFEVNLIYFIQTVGVTDLLLCNNALCIEGAEAELLEDITYNYGGVFIYDSAPEPDIYAEMAMPSDDVVNDISY